MDLSDILSQVDGPLVHFTLQELPVQVCSERCNLHNIHVDLSCLELFVNEMKCHLFRTKTK